MISLFLQENVGGTTYFYPTSAENSHTSNDTMNSLSGSSSITSSYQVYPGTPSHIATLKVRGGTSSYFITEDTRIEILNRNALTLLQTDPEQFPGIFSMSFLFTYFYNHNCINGFLFAKIYHKKLIIIMNCVHWNQLQQALCIKLL